MQKSIAQMHNCFEAAGQKQKDEFKRIDAQVSDPYDNIIAKYDYRQKQQDSFPPEVEAAQKASGDAISRMRDLADPAGKIKQNRTKGWGVGAFLGRLVSGRLLESSRASGDAQTDYFSTETYTKIINTNNETLYTKHHPPHLARRAKQKFPPLPASVVGTRPYLAATVITDTPQYCQKPLPHRAFHSIMGIETAV